MAIIIWSYNSAIFFPLFLTCKNENSKRTETKMITSATKMPNNLQKMMRTIVLTKITIIIIQQKLSTWDKKHGHKACDKFIHIMTVWHLYWYI